MKTYEITIFHKKGFSKVFYTDNNSLEDFEKELTKTYGDFITVSSTEVIGNINYKGFVLETKAEGNKTTTVAFYKGEPIFGTHSELDKENSIEKAIKKINKWPQ